ncbi:MAG: helix-turn-helix domain-containing protein [Nitrososphaerales archaeon]
MASTCDFIERNVLHTKIVKLDVKDLERINGKIVETLLELGLTSIEAKVLLFINKKGEMGASEIARNLEIPRTQVYKILEGLQGKGLVYSTLARPAKFRAMAFDKALDFLLQSFKHKLNSLERAKESIMHDWSLLQENEVIAAATVSEEGIQTISGESQINSKVKDLLMRAEKEVVVIANARNLAKFSYDEITDRLQQLASSGVVVKVLTRVQTHQLSLLEEIDRCMIKEIPRGFNETTNFVIADGKELLLLNANKESALWTNSRSFVDTMSFLFSMGWHLHDKGYMLSP